MSIFANVAACQAIDGLTIPPNSDCLVVDIGTGNSGRFRFLPGSTAADASNQTVIAPTTNPSAGKWHRSDMSFDLKLPVGFGTTDGAVLYTVPTGFGSRMRITRAFWEITTGFSGGVSSTIGLSSSSALYGTNGDLLGGAAGDLAAVLTTALLFTGAIGTKLASLGTVVLVPGDTIKFNRIVSAFTAGAGFAHVCVDLLSL